MLRVRFWPRLEPATRHVGRTCLGNGATRFVIMSREALVEHSVCANRYFGSVKEANRAGGAFCADCSEEGGATTIIVSDVKSSLAARQETTVQEREANMADPTTPWKPGPNPSTYNLTTLGGKIMSSKGSGNWNPYKGSQCLNGWSQATSIEVDPNGAAQPWPFRKGTITFPISKSIILCYAYQDQYGDGDM